MPSYKPILRNRTSQSSPDLRSVILKSTLIFFFCSSLTDAWRCWTRTGSRMISLRRRSCSAEHRQVCPSNLLESELVISRGSRTMTWKFKPDCLDELVLTLIFHVFVPQNQVAPSLTSSGWATSRWVLAKIQHCSDVWYSTNIYKVIFSFFTERRRVLNSHCEIQSSNVQTCELLLFYMNMKGSEDWVSGLCTGQRQ